MWHSYVAIIIVNYWFCMTKLTMKLSITIASYVVLVDTDLFTAWLSGHVVKAVACLSTMQL